MSQLKINWENIRTFGLSHNSALKNDSKMEASKLTYQELEQKNKYLRQKLREHESEGNFSRYFHSNKAIMLQVHTDTKQIIDTNDAAVDFYGYPKTELLKKSINELNIMPLEEIEKKMKEALINKTNFFQFQHKLADGKIRNVEVFASPLRLRGELLMVATVYDVTNRKFAEHELLAEKEKAENNEQSLRDAQKTAHLGNWELDIAKNKLKWSDEIFRIFNLKPQQFEATYETFLDNIHPDDRGFVNKAYLDSLENKTPYEIEHRLMLKNGEIKHVIEKCKTDFDKSGKAIRSIGIVQDITLRKIAEQELIIAKEKAEKNEVLFSAITDQSTEGITVADMEGYYLYANPAFCKMSGYSKEELLKLTVFDMKAKEQVRQSFYDSKEKMEGLPIRVNLQRKNGIKYLTEIIGKIINIDKKQLVLGTIRDITETVKAEEELVRAKEKAEESDMLKTEFINNMSHEIRTPMNGILGFSSFLDNQGLTDEKRNQYVKIIKNSGHQLLRIIDDILEISKLSTKQVKTIESEICLNDLLLEQFLVFDIKAKENGIPLYLKKGLSDNESRILIDDIKLNKILSNLLENALKFTNEGFIELGYKLKSGTGPAILEIYVKDTGVGIKPESQKVIFDRFSQEEIKGTQKHGGLGLGLSIAKENAELLGGDITFKSEKGKGAIFYVTIPYKPTAPGSAKIKHDGNETIASKLEKYTVLIVEDEEVNYLYIDTLLESFDLKIQALHAKHGREAVEICKGNPEIGLVLMDLKMPVLNGFDATKQIKEFRPDLPIIAQTAYSTKEEREQAFLAGCDDFISKPISKEIFNKTINKYLPGNKI